MPEQQPARKVTTTYINYEGRREAFTVEEGKGCLELLALLPFIRIIYQILSSQL